MTQQELNQEVATQTGESICVIKTMGFSPLQESILIEERREPLVVDWDEVHRTQKLERIF